MYRESLERARTLITQLISLDEETNIVDKVELMVNIDKFLNPDAYDENIRILNGGTNNGRILRMGLQNKNKN